MRRQIINWTRPLSPRRAKARAVIADFGRNVRARRRAAGLKQTDLARICQVGADFICHVEKGLTNPSLETMALIAAGLNCTVADLLTGHVPVAPSISTEDMDRARDALAVLGAIFGQSTI